MTNFYYSVGFITHRMAIPKMHTYIILHLYFLFIYLWRIKNVSNIKIYGNLILETYFLMYFKYVNDRQQVYCISINLILCGI